MNARLMLVLSALLAVPLVGVVAWKIWHRRNKMMDAGRRAAVSPPRNLGLVR
jgi:Flp pilus assembly protein CpaB